MNEIKIAINGIETAFQQLYIWEAVSSDVERILELVQNNQWYFGNPPASKKGLAVAADKLDELIKAAKSKPENEPFTPIELLRLRTDIERSLYQVAVAIEAALNELKNANKQ
jgi:hypothetical protein